MKNLIANYVTTARRVVYLEMYQKDYATGEDWYKALTYAKREEKEALYALAKETGITPTVLKGESLNKIKEDSGYALLRQFEHKYRPKPKPVVAVLTNAKDDDFERGVVVIVDGKHHRNCGCLDCHPSDCICKLCEES
jgi:mitochondrial fission protein ELM1